MKSFLLAAVVGLLHVQVSLAQDSIFYKNSIDVRMSTPGIRPCFHINQVFVGDYLLGFGGGVYDSQKRWSARLQFDFRPYFKSVTFSENDTLRHQYREKDFYLHLALEKQFRLKTQYPMLLPFVQVNAGLLWGNFKAFDKAPESKWIISPAAGLDLAINPVFHFKLGYQYLKPLVLERPPHRIMFQILFVIDDLD
jgi:hypothetical protein